MVSCIYWSRPPRESLRRPGRSSKERAAGVLMCGFVAVEERFDALVASTAPSATAGVRFCVQTEARN